MAAVLLIAGCRATTCRCEPHLVRCGPSTENGRLEPASGSHEVFAEARSSTSRHEWPRWSVTEGPGEEDDRWHRLIIYGHGDGDAGMALLESFAPCDPNDPNFPSYDDPASHRFGFDDLGTALKWLQLEHEMAAMRGDRDRVWIPASFIESGDSPTREGIGLQPSDDRWRGDQGGTGIVPGGSPFPADRVESGTERRSISEHSSLP